jgi:hypothetical protein
MISIVVLAWGEPGNRYSGFVGRWWEAVMAMSPKPAEVVVVHSEPEPLGLLNAAPAGMKLVAVPCEGTAPQMANAGVRAASQPWFSAIGVDDTYRPDAFKHLEAATQVGAEIVVWNHQERDSDHVWECFWSPAVLRRANTVQGASPVRRSLWERAGGFPDVAWWDWGFWLRAAAAGAVAMETGAIGVDFDAGRNHETFSGPALPAEIRANRDREIFRLVQDIFP